MQQPFISFREEDKNGELQYYVLQREWPHYVSLVTQNQNYKSIINVPIAGYNMYIVFNGTLRAANLMPIYNGVDEAILKVYQDMATWFLDNRILTNEKKYAKWKLK